MNNKLKIILILLLVIAIVLLAIFWYLSNKQANENQRPVVVPVVNQSSEDQTVNLNANTNANVAPETPILPEVSDADKLKAQLTKMISAFVERYGSYSNQSDFENLEDLMPFMSQKLKAWAEDFIATKRAQAQPAAIYYGLTTKVMNTEILDFSPETGAVKFKVSTQKQEVAGTSLNAKVYYQDAELNLVEEGGMWKVDEVMWK